MRTPSAALIKGLFLVAVCAAGSGRAEEAGLITEQNTAVEWTLVSPSPTSSKRYPDPFNDVTLDALVTAPDGSTLRLPAFWAGGESWRFRYASGQTGLHRWRSECSDRSNPALHGAGGNILVQPYTGSNPLRRRGPIRVAASRRHFEHEDGTPFFWLGDTWWMGLSKRLIWPEEFQALAADRVKKGFTVVQIVAGLYPDMPAFDPRGAGEAGLPWTEDYARVNPAYFDAADRRIEWLVRSGIAPCIVGAWGYHLPWLGVERMKRHWRNLVARYGAHPVVWCVAGEGIMPYYLSTAKPADQAFQKKGWTEVAAYIRQVDPFRRPVSIHPTDSARNQVEDAAVLDFDMLQTGHGDRGSIPGTLRLVRASRGASPPMPTLNAEVCYEGILGTCHQDVQRFMTWSCLLSGAAGHTYGANGIWQVNRRDEPFGKSPHGGNWGNTPWDEAARLPGSAQVGLARRLLERLDWTRFEPHPEWSSFERPEPFTWGDWIWFPEPSGDPARDAPVEPRFFRRSFEVPAGDEVRSAVLRLSVDDRFSAFLNGKPLASHHGWKPHREIDVRPALMPGKNTLAVRAENAAADVPANPAGLIACLQVRHASGKAVEVRSDASWRSAQREEKGWSETGFDDRGWNGARTIGRHGDPPWGALEPDQTLTPFAAGIPGKTRVIYFPAARPATVHGIEPGARYRAASFSPVTGEERALGTAEAGPGGSWPVPAPGEAVEDWVLVLESGG